MTAPKVWNGTAWELASGGSLTAAVQAGAPSGPVVGQLWLDTDEIAQGGGNGPYLCTSGTRPTHQAGLMIYETDTSRVYISNGTTWRYLYGGTDPTAARAWAGATTSLAAAAFTTVAFNTEEYDYGNNFASNTYTAPRAGLLEVSASALCTSAQGDRLVGSLYNSGGEVARGTDIYASASNAGAHVSTVLNIAAGEQITFRVWTSAAGRSTTSGQPLTYMSCRMIP